MTRGKHAFRGRRVLSALSVGVAAATVLGVGPAYAFFTGAGTGSGKGRVGVGQSFTITTSVTVPTGTLLYPQGPRGGITLSIDRGAQPFTVTSLRRDISRAVVVANAGTGGCLNPGIALLPVDLNIDVNAAVTRTIPAVVSISDSADNGCQGATFAIPVILTGVIQR